MDNIRMTVPEAAKHLGIGNNELMAWFKSKSPPPFGVYIKQDGKKNGRYLIYRERLMAYKNATDLTANPPPVGG